MGKFADAIAFSIVMIIIPVAIAYAIFYKMFQILQPNGINEIIIYIVISIAITICGDGIYFLTLRGFEVR